MTAEIGTDDVALLANDAVAAALSLRGIDIAVLGGDVFYKVEQGFELAYANWHSDPEVGEDANAFVSRSVQEASDYIQMFRSYAVKPQSSRWWFPKSSDH